MAAPPRKTAVVYVLDTSSSMNAVVCAKQEKVAAACDSSKQPPPAHHHRGDSGGDTTRLECGKKALRSMMADLMLQSQQNEASIILTKTKQTMHHKIAEGVDLEEWYGDDIPFPNLTEHPPGGLARPTIELLRRIDSIQAEPDTSALRGDIMDAFILAADAIHERTAKYKFQRKIVLITDAGHDVVLNVEQILVIIDSLRQMECRLEVIGIDFDSATTVYDEPAAATNNIDIRPDQAVSSSTAVDDDAAKVKSDPDDMEAEGLNKSGDGPLVYTQKADREALLLSLAEKTGGQVSSVSSLQDILDASKGKRAPKTMQYKFEFRIAPGLKIQARRFNLFSATNLPTLKKEVTALSKGGETEFDENGNEMARPYTKKILWVDEDNPDVTIADDDKTTALPFGSTLVPMSGNDFEGIVNFSREQPWLEVIGCMHRDKIPTKLISGPPIGIGGSESNKACAAVAALAQALHRTGRVAIGTFLKVKSSPFPRLTVIYPLEEEQHLAQPIHLVALSIPYEGEVIANLSKSVFPVPDDKKVAVCENLIRSLMLSDGVLESGRFANPVLRSWHQTVLEKALYPTAPIVKETIEKTPRAVLAASREALSAFSSTFPFKRQEKEGNKTAAKKKGRKTTTYTDFQ